ncbi:hypothetical protein EON65_14950 [archaeon]|nr:MAG: hypothetical protein EON65_14950 [archaeon]
MPCCVQIPRPILHLFTQLFVAYMKAFYLYVEMAEQTYLAYMLYLTAQRSVSPDFDKTHSGEVAKTLKFFELTASPSHYLIDKCVSFTGMLRQIVEQVFHVLQATADMKDFLFLSHPHIFSNQHENEGQTLRYRLLKIPLKDTAQSSVTGPLGGPLHLTVDMWQEMWLLGDYELLVAFASLACPSLLASTAAEGMCMCVCLCMCK